MKKRKLTIISIVALLPFATFVSGSAVLCLQLANIISLSYGAFSAWPSASFLELQADNSTLDTGPMTNTETGYVGSSLCIGGILGTFFFAWCADKVGRKNCLLLTAIPSLISWGIIVVARNPFQLCVSRFFGGFCGGGVLIVIPLYVTEISETKIRGELGALFILFNSVGILVAYVLGYFFTYTTVALILSLVTVLFIILFAFQPESPEYLMLKNKTEEAEKVLRYLRNVGDIFSKSSLEIKEELDRMLVVEELYAHVGNSRITWSDINNRIARKALTIGLVVLLLTQLCGCFALLSYMAPVFQKAGSNMSPNMAAIVVGVIQILASYVSTMLVDRVGRKILMVSSTFGTGVGLTFLGGYEYFAVLGYDIEYLNWIPLASFSFIIFISCIGVVTLPYLIVCEILPPKIRNMGNMFCMSMLWVLTYLILMYFPVLSEEIGMHGVMFIFGANCFVGAIFLILYLPETKGKSIESILEML